MQELAKAACSTPADSLARLKKASFEFGERRKGESVPKNKKNTP